MAEACVLKSTKYGICIVLDEEIGFDDLVTAVCKKFATAKNYFGKRSVVLEVRGRELSDAELSVVVEAIHLNSEIRIVYIDEGSDLKDVRMIDKIDRFYADNIFENAKIVKRSIKSNTTVSSDTSLIVIGDVKSKAKIVAAGNIIVIGELEGMAHAGFPENNNCYVVANTLTSNKISIGTISSNEIKSKKGLRFNKKSDEPEAVVVFNNELYKEPVYSGILKDK